MKTLQPVAMITPNKEHVYTPSRIRKPVTKSTTNMQPRQITVSFEPDGVSDPQLMTAYSRGTDCWYIEVK